MALAAYSVGRCSNLFDTFTFIGLNKIGIWALFVLIYDFDYIIGTHPYLHTYRVDVMGLAALILTLSCWGVV